MSNLMHTDADLRTLFKLLSVYEHVINVIEYNIVNLMETLGNPA